MTMRVIVGLFLALTLQLCFAQQTSPVGLQSLDADVLVWSASWRLPNITSVSSWDAFNSKTLTTAGSAPTLLANQFNSVVPGVSFSGSQCLSSTTIGTPSSATYSVYVVARLPGVGVHVLAAQEQASNVGYSLILSINGTTIELGFYVDGALLGSVSAESGVYIQGDPMLFWYTQDASSGTIGFDTLTNSFTSGSATFTTTVTTAVGCNKNGNHLTGVVGEVLILKTGNNTAVHNIVMNSLAARFGITSLPTKIYTGATDQNSNCDEDVSGIGSESNGAVLSGNSIQLTISKQTALPAGDYIMFGRVPDDGDLFAYPYQVNYTRFSRVWFVTVSVQGQINSQATADVSFDVSSVKDVMAANNASYFLLYQATSSSPYQIVNENGIVSADNNTVTFSGASLSTGFYTIGSTAKIPESPQAPNSGPAAGPVAGPAAPTSGPTYAYPSPGIVRRSDAVGTTVSVVSAVMLAVSLLF